MILVCMNESLSISHTLIHTHTHTHTHNHTRTNARTSESVTSPLAVMTLRVDIYIHILIIDIRAEHMDEYIHVYVPLWHVHTRIYGHCNTLHHTATHCSTLQHIDCKCIYTKLHVNSHIACIHTHMRIDCKCIYKTVSTANATLPKSTKSRNSNSSWVRGGTHSNGREAASCRAPSG